MQLKYFKYVILAILFMAVTGCITRKAPIFSIDELPNSTVGQNYSVVIGMWREFLTEDDLYLDITPSNSGFSIRCLIDDRSFCYGVELYGFAKNTGRVKVKIKGKKNKSIYKEYTIKVTP